MIVATLTVCKSDAIARIIGPVVLVIAFVFLVSILIISLLRVARSLANTVNEQKLLRLEVTKLADEVEKTRMEKQNSGQEG